MSKQLENKLLELPDAGESETYSGYAEGIPVERHPSRRQQLQIAVFGRSNMSGLNLDFRS